MEVGPVGEERICFTWSAPTPAGRLDKSGLGRRWRGNKGTPAEVNIFLRRKGRTRISYEVSGKFFVAMWEPDKNSVGICLGKLSLT